MVFLFAGRGSRKLLAIGITDANIEKLKEDKPIFKMAEEFNLSKFECNDIMIFYGKTEQEIYKHLKDNGVLKDTKIVQYGKPTKQ